MLKRFGKVATLGLVVALLGIYLGDAIVYRVRISRGTAYRAIVVNQFLVTPLKGQKEEYDVVGTVQVTCSRTLLPQPGYPACWWQERHAAQWE